MSVVKILVIEDDKPILDDIADILTLETDDFCVLKAANGQIGLELAFEELPDLIICDLMMPQVDGYSVLNSLRTNPNTVKIPFIFLTAMADQLYARQSQKLGANHYLTKPFTAKDLLKAVNDQLQKQS